MPRPKPSRKPASASPKKRQEYDDPHLHKQHSRQHTSKATNGAGDGSAMATNVHPILGERSHPLQEEQSAHESDGI